MSFRSQFCQDSRPDLLRQKLFHLLAKAKLSRRQTKKPIKIRVFPCSVRLLSHTRPCDRINCLLIKSNTSERRCNLPLRSETNKTSGSHDNFVFVSFGFVLPNMRHIQGQFLSNFLNFCRTLLELGASANYKDAKMLTPLYYAVVKKTDEQIVKALLHDHAKLGTTDLHGWQEIHQVSEETFAFDSQTNFVSAGLSKRVSEPSGAFAELRR